MTAKKIGNIEENERIMPLLDCLRFYFMHSSTTNAHNVQQQLLLWGLHKQSENRVCNCRRRASGLPIWPDVFIWVIFFGEINSSPRSHFHCACVICKTPCKRHITWNTAVVCSMAYFSRLDLVVLVKYFQFRKPPILGHWTHIAGVNDILEIRIPQDYRSR